MVDVSWETPSNVLILKRMWVVIRWMRRWRVICIPSRSSTTQRLDEPFPEPENARFSSLQIPTVANNLCISQNDLASYARTLNHNGMVLVSSRHHILPSSPSSSPATAVSTKTKPHRTSSLPSRCRPPASHDGVWDITPLAGQHDTHVPSRGIRLANSFMPFSTSYPFRGGGRRESSVQVPLGEAGGRQSGRVLRGRLGRQPDPAGLDRRMS